MTLKTRIIIAGLIAILFVSITLIATSWMAQNEIESRLDSALINGKQAFWEETVDGHIERMESEMSSLTRDRTSLNAIRNNDTATLTESLTSTFNRLSASNLLSELTIVDTDARVLFSTLESLAGKISERILIKQAISEGKVKTGIEQNEFKHIEITLSFPLYRRGKLIGGAVMSHHLGGSLDEFKEHGGSDAFVFDTDGSLVYATDKELVEQFDISLPPPGTNESLILEANDAYYGTIIVPILDPVGTPIAHLISTKDQTESIQTQKTINLISIIASITSVIIMTLILSWYITRSFKPLHTAIEVISKVAQGDLTSEINVTTSDETGQLLSAMNKMVEKLHGMITQITASTSQITSASEEMAIITIKANEATQRQRSDTEQAATATTEMAQTVQEVARSAAHAADAAREANREASDGKLIVADTIEAIGALAADVESTGQAISSVSQESDNIGIVAQVIRDIAEQTNLLALNAAIEAARAGEQGRGFAVVADEVRTLASRTQQSTQEIQTTIEKLQTEASHAVQVMEQSRTRAQSSVAQSGKAGASLETITAAVATINDMNTQIAGAAEEQSTVAEEINKNVTSISSATEQVAESSDKTSDTSQKMASLSRDLQSLVTQFKI